MHMNTLEDNNKLGNQEIRVGLDWIDLAQDRHQWWDFVNMVVNLWIP
jgi:hypothetical protein